ncbi:VOC family protein [Deinococcus aquaedulcis]|uniref:hypothetical protein n=1 Tax=Deinococcus aquaedulcis TaxID=2840455 RepID=UPI001C832013|nr:hypothetical protein [Deinococcus aquaedulcis]
MDETRTVALPIHLLKEVQSALEPDQSVEDWLISAIYQSLTLQENHASSPLNRAFFEPLAEFTPSLLLQSHDPAACALFYQKLGFRIVQRADWYYILRSKGMELTITKSNDNCDLKEASELCFNSKINFRLLIVPLEQMGIPVEIEENELDPCCLRITDPDGRHIAIYSVWLDEIGLMRAGYM